MTVTILIVNLLVLFFFVMLMKASDRATELGIRHKELLERYEAILADYKQVIREYVTALHKK